MEIFKFSYTIKVDKFHFDCTNFALCKECLVAAISKSVETAALAERIQIS